MTGQVRRVGWLMLGLFAILLVNLNVLQVVRAPALAENPGNDRLLIREYASQRGPIVAGDREIARSVETDGDLRYLRAYPEGPLYAHLTGFHSFVYGRTQLERSLNDELVGASPDALSENLVELFGDRELVGDTVRLTIEPDVQATAARALGQRTGAVVAVDARTGRVLAQYANPSYDPNPLASGDGATVINAWDQLRLDPSQPLLDRATQEVYPPGSTFKLVVAAAALERGLSPSTALENPAAYLAPQTSNPIENFSPGPCNGGGATITLADALRVSCNTAFASLGVQLGAEEVRRTAMRLGYEADVPSELDVATSRFPEGLDPPSLAQSAIGQRDVRTTVLHQALVTAAIADGGTLRRPLLVEEVVDRTGRLVRASEPRGWDAAGSGGQALSSQTASLLREMMIDAVENGTGGGARIAGLLVGGKTGTAQVPEQSPTVWFTGFAERPDTGALVAIAVVLPDAGDDATGGGLAAPIARAVLEAAMAGR